MCTYTPTQKCILFINWLVLIWIFKIRHVRVRLCFPAQIHDRFLSVIVCFVMVFVMDGCRCTSIASVSVLCLCVLFREFGLSVWPWRIVSLDWNICAHWVTHMYTYTCTYIHAHAYPKPTHTYTYPYAYSSCKCITAWDSLGCGGIVQFSSDLLVRV